MRDCIAPIERPRLGIEQAPQDFALAARNERLVVMASSVRPISATGESGSNHVPIVSIYSVDDNIVAPQKSSRLAEAENIVLSGLGHLSLLYSDAVAAHVVRAVRTPRAAL